MKERPSKRDAKAVKIAPTKNQVRIRNRVYKTGRLVAKAFNLVNWLALMDGDGNRLERAEDNKSFCREQLHILLSISKANRE